MSGSKEKPKWGVDEDRRLFATKMSRGHGTCRIKRPNLIAFASNSSSPTWTSFAVDGQITVTMFPSLVSLMKLPSVPFKRMHAGLYHGKKIQFGNNVPFSKHKTRRTWLPNIQKKRLFSEALQKEVKLKVSMTALKTIRKVRIRSDSCCPFYEYWNLWM